MSTFARRHLEQSGVIITCKVFRKQDAQDTC